MKNILYILACLVVALALGSSYCEGSCICVCKCKCHDGLETCQEFCWRCAHKHHVDCECLCHDEDSPNGSTSEERNYSFRRRYCDDCLRFHFDREYSTDYGMRKGLLPKKRPYLHPIKDYQPNLMYSFDADCCE